MTLVAGQADTLHISDLFYAESYALAFLPHATIQARYDRQLGLLILTAAPHAEGLTLLSFRHEGEVYQIPVFLQILQRHRFQYHLRKAAQKVNVMGSFNGWNRNNLPMHDENGDNIYEMILPLEPGRYEYKFVIDTEEILDPENPEIVSNNIGGYNSVLTIPPRHPEKSVLHLLGSKTTGPDLELIFVYERENQPAALRHEHIIALINNQKIAEKKILIVGNQIGVRLDQDLLKGSTTVRVAVTQNGHSTLMQSVRLYDGRPAGSTPAWFSWHDAVIYAMMIDRFDDGDPTNTRPVVHAELHPKVNYFGGDLQGIIRQIDAGYFDSLGVNALWLSPVNENTDRAHREWPPPHRYFSAYHGYWPTHHEKVEERFGDLNLLKTLVAKAHAHGLKVLLDFIAHHVHEDHPFYKAHRDWFGVLDLPDGRKNIRFWDEHRLTTWFEPFLPSFDYLGSQAALDTMTDNAIWWLEQTNADGFRHDAVKHIPNQFWRILTQKIKRQIEIPQNRKIYQIGETFGGYDLVSSYVNNGQLDAQFNFNLYFTARGVFLTPGASFAILANEMQKTFSVYGVDHLMSNIMDSHDQVRYMAYA
ncbi:MAG: alpha-amylase family glycosyl hydrolase, partial [candidate division KSB1 bacterium]|nr:alpha-amylase family glycosyl hydrolase [candidate division KSB1 bacterium]